jgi:hypothetical protein
MIASKLNICQLVLSYYLLHSLAHECLGLLHRTQWILLTTLCRRWVNGHYQVDEFHVLKFVKARSEINGFMSGFGLSEEYTMYNIQGL